jgi:hypothetical protein
MKNSFNCSYEKKLQFCFPYFCINFVERSEKGKIFLNF